MENETAVSRQFDLTLDLFNGEGEPTPNKFHVSEERLVDLKRNSIPNNVNVTSNLNGITAEESIVETKIVKSEILDDEFDSKVAAHEYDASEEEAPDKNFIDYKQQRSLPSNQEENDNEDALEEDDDEAAKDEEISEETSRKFSRIAKKFSIQSDIEEVDEETEAPIIEDFQQSGRAKTGLGSGMVSTEALLLQAKSKLILRAASILEQRLKTISDLKDTFEERKKLGLKNRFLNEKCCQHLKKITTVNYFESTAGALPIYGNQRYYNILEEFMETKTHYDKTKPVLEVETQNLTDSYYICRSRYDQVLGDFTSRELEVGSDCIYGKSGKVLNEQKLQSLVKKQQRKFEQLAEVRVYYLKLHHRLGSIQKSLRALNLMGEGHTLMEYEQLMIINNISMDKLDERAEELQKLRDKCTEDVSILSYMKETSEALVNDIIDAAEGLEEVAEKKNEARSLLAVQRLKRDSLRKNALKMHSTTGLLTSPRLLRKMEVDSQALAVLKRKVDRSRRGTVMLMRSESVVARSETNRKKTTH